MMKKRLLAGILAFAVVIGTTAPTANFRLRNENAYAADTVQTNIGVSLTNTVMKAGVPVKAVLNGITAADVKYSWTVGGKAVNTSGDSYTPTENDYEKMISVTVTADGKSYTASAYFSTLPVVYISTDEEITSKTEYIAGTCHIQGNSEFSNAAQLYSGAISIRGRGNYTWEHNKKPYKIKLDTKTDVLGMGESKHWVLLAEYMDPTHLRNEVMPELSKTLGFDYTADSEAVAVVLNGEYNGMYHLGENVRVAGNRVNIYDWEGTAEDIAKALYKKQKSSGMTKDDRDALEDQLVEDLEWVTSGTFTWNGTEYKVSDFVTLPSGIDGGYLLELDTYDDYHVKQVSDFETEGQQPIQFKSPEYAVTNSEMYNYAKNYIQSFENAVSADDYYADYDGRSQHYSDLFDMDSLVEYWLMLELSSNCDGMRYSNFMYKDFGEKFKMGPSWDYDWTWNASYIVPTNEWWTDQEYYNQTAHWYKYLALDPYFITQAYELYQANKNTFAKVYADGGMIDTYASELELPAKADLAKWHEKQVFDDEVAKTKEYVTERFKWLDEQFSDVETLAKSLGYEASDKLTVTDIASQNGKLQITAQVTDSQAAAVTFHINGILAGEADVQNGTAVLTIGTELLKNKDDALNTVQIRMKNADGEYLAEEEKQSSSDPWGRGGWDPWGQTQQTDVGSLVYSNFKSFTAEELGLSVSVKGDVNMDGEFNISDVVLLQKWLLAVPDTKLANWKAGDLSQDGRLDDFDIIMMRQLLANI